MKSVYRTAAAVNGSIPQFGFCGRKHYPGFKEALLEKHLLLNAKLQAVEVTISGEFDVEDAKSVINEAVSAARSRGWSRFFFDIREAKVAASTMDAFRLMAHLDTVGFERSDRIAAIVSFQRRLHEFTENITRNRGWQTLFTEDVEAAREWIK